MAWLLIAAVVVIVVAIAFASIFFAIASTIWAFAVRDGIRLVERLSRRSD
jgi:hypothetical protein